MPYLKLRNARTGEVQEFERADVRIGRAPDLELILDGEGSEVVSGNHALMCFREGAWVLEDTGSTNGTFVDEQRLTASRPVPLRSGSTVSFGAKGPRFKVEAVAAAKLSATVVEGQPAVSPYDATVPMSAADLAANTAPMDVPPPPPREESARPDQAPVERAAPEAPAPPRVHIVLLDERSGDTVERDGVRFRIGRGRECEIRPVQEGDTSVSRVHAEIVLKPDHAIVLRDAGSRNGTTVNGNLVRTEHELREGDRIQLGNEGPELVVSSLVGGRTPAGSAPAPAPAQKAPQERKEASKPTARRSFAGKGKTMFFREMMEETTQKSSARLRIVVLGFSVMLVGGVGGLWWFSEQRMQQTSEQLEEQRQALADQQAIADSLRNSANAEYERLRDDLALAQTGSASSAVLDSLRQALVEAQERTEALETSMRRAQGELNQQLARAEAERREREAEVQRLRSEMAAASSGGVPQGLLDSLRRAVSDAEQQLSGIEGQVRAVRGVDLATVAQTNQGAVGLVSSFAQGRIYDGSGFAITSSGYFITNRHVVMHNGLRSDSLFVMMADQRRMLRADIINVAPGNGPDIAVIRIRNYTGPHVPRVDWAGDKARQGEPAALIGFPAGLANALDDSQTIRTSMSGGIFSQVRADEIRFDGFTVGGSSGSPVLNANGEVVAIHRAGLAEAAGLGFAVPVRLAIPLLPPDARAEAGIGGR